MVACKSEFGCELQQASQQEVNYSVQISGTCKQLEKINAIITNLITAHLPLERTLSFKLFDQLKVSVFANF